MTQHHQKLAFHSYSTSRGMGMTRSEAVAFLDETYTTFRPIATEIIDSFEARVIERFTRERDEATALYTTLIEGGSQ